MAVRDKEVEDDLYAWGDTWQPTISTNCADPDAPASGLVCSIVLSGKPGCSGKKSAPAYKKQRGEPSRCVRA